MNDRMHAMVINARTVSIFAQRGAFLPAGLKQVRSPHVQTGPMYPHARHRPTVDSLGALPLKPVVFVRKKVLKVSEQRTTMGEHCWPRKKQKLPTGKCPLILTALIEASLFWHFFSRDWYCDCEKQMNIVLHHIPSYLSIELVRLLTQKIER